MTRFMTDKPKSGSAAEHAARIGNRYGYFTEDGAEFCITDPRTPRPWANIIATPGIGLAVSQTGSGFTWIDNSQLATVTRWEQDFARDASGKFLYVRDADRGEVWSLSPAPCWPSYDRFACHHGIGYSTFKTAFAGIEAEWTLLCHPQLPVELWRVQLTNTSSETRRLELTAFLEWCCGVSPSPRREFHKLFIETDFDVERPAVFARNHMWDVPTEQHGHWNTGFPYVSALASIEPALSAQADKAAFFGQYGDLAAPAALAESTWRPRFGRYEDPVAALRSVVVLRAGQTLTTGYALAVAPQRERVNEILDETLNVAAIDRALADAAGAWKKRLATHRVSTPDTSVDYLTNDWLRYQAISGRIFGRCGYYQQSGAYGYRDQLQDSQVWLTIDPDRCRKQIGLHAGHQFADGSVYHWWHPLSEQGLVTKMTDDLLWLGFVTANYIKETGQFDVLDDAAPFLDDDTKAPLIEHVERAFARVFERSSPRGLPYIGAGDWNDGLSAAGLEEKGESIWLGHFLAGLLIDWVAIYERTGRADRAADLRTRLDKLLAALNTHGWDGDWYLRATLDDGSKLGSASSRVGKIFLNAQTWAILNDVADASRAKTCWDAVRKHLIREVGALLLSPAFDEPVPEIGYITRYAPGLRENGGVYTHAATWAIAAAAKMRDAESVGNLLDAINPTNKDPEKYWAEPYVTPGNVDGPESPYYGRGGWTWYTGSAAWLHRVVSEWVLGVRPVWDGLQVSPCLPPDWNEAQMTRPYRGCTYAIQIERDASLPAGAVELTLDGEALSNNVIPPPRKPGASFDVHVRFA